MRRTVMVAVLAAIVGALVAAPVAVYASHQFSDVPNTNPFHDDIDWLAEAEVTLGCGAGQYCPKDPVTREQMAAFMHRLGTNQVVDAGQLGGFAADELGSRAAFLASGDTPDSSSSYEAQMEISAPAGGLLLMSGGVEAYNLVDDSTLFCRFLVDDTNVAGSERYIYLDGSSGIDNYAPCTTMGAVPVAAGTHTVTFVVSSVTEADELVESSAWALWVPFAGTGSAP